MEEEEEELEVEAEEGGGDGRAEDAPIESEEEMWLEVAKAVKTAPQLQVLLAMLGVSAPRKANRTKPPRAVLQQHFAAVMALRRDDIALAVGKQLAPRLGWHLRSKLEARGLMGGYGGGG